MRNSRKNVKVPCPHAQFEKTLILGKDDIHMRTKLIIAIMAVLLMSGLSVLAVGASSHNDAPLIAEDPTANNTDVYAFVSTEPGHADKVTVIANYIPLVEPGDGPTYKNFSENATYRIFVDTNGDGKRNLNYTFKFKNDIANGGTFLYNTGPIGSPPNPSDPTSQYTNLNFKQSYTMTEVTYDSNGKRIQIDEVLKGARVAPANIGPVSTGSQADYEALANDAIHSIGTGPNEMRAFVGPRDDGFYADLMGAFDLLNIRGPGFDTFSGFNVYTIALEIPKSRFQQAGDTDGVIGVWADATRPRVTILNGSNRQGPRVSEQISIVSRLGNPLVNEVLMPLDIKNVFNSSEPTSDEANNIDEFIINPGNSQGGASLVPLLNTITGCTPENGRSDLALVFLSGIPAGVVPGFDGNMDTQGTGNPLSEMLRLNYNIAPSTSPNSLGILGGDVAGFPNGRRVGDDVLDVALKGAAGGVLQALGAIDPATCNVAPLDLSDNVDGNDVPYLSEFPYLGTPHQGYEHSHSHGSPVSVTTLGIGAGLTATGLVLAGLIAVRRRRNSPLG